MAPNSVVLFHPSIPPAFNFLLEPQPEPTWGYERLLVDRAEHAANISWCQICGGNCRVPRHRDYSFVSMQKSRSASTSTFEFFGDTNTPLPGPFREPIKFRYFEHTPDCSNKISPNHLLDSYDRPLNVRACPHCHGRLRKGESAPNTWCTPLHWDVSTQEIFAARKIPGSSRSAYRDTLKWVTRPVIEDGVQKVEGDWEEWVVPELKSWSTSRKSHPLDQNYFEAARMQGAVQNNFCIFRVLPDESNTPQISHSYIQKIDDTGKKLTKPIVCLRMDVDPGDRVLEEGLDESDTKRHYRFAPWKPMRFVFENDGEVFRVWWLSIGKAKVTTNTARLREEYELESKTHFERAVLLREASPRDRVLRTGDLRWFLTALPSPTKEEKAEWNRILKEYGLPELKIGTRETRAISTTRQTTQGRTVRVEHDSTSGVRVNTLRQSEIRRMRKAAKKTDPPLPDELLSKYVDGMSLSDADPICRGGCFALVQLHHLELKRLGAYSTPAKEVWVAFALERRKSIRNAIKYERKTANRNGLSQEVLQQQIDRARTRIELAYEHAEVFRRRHCIEHG